MLKCAYIFFGQVKNYTKHQYKSFVEHVADPLRVGRVETDYYLVTSNNNKFKNLKPKPGGAEGIEKEEREINPLSMCEFFNFKNILFDGLEDKNSEINKEIEKYSKMLVHNKKGCPSWALQEGGAWGSHSLESTINSLKQIYSLEYFFNFFKKIEKQERYDIYILSRCDLFHTSRLSHERIRRFYRTEKGAKTYHRNKDLIIVPSFGWWKGGCNDRFAVFNSMHSMEKYCSRYSSIKKHKEWYHAENYLLKHLESEKIKVERLCGFNFRLVRSGGEVTNLSGRRVDESLQGGTGGET